MSHCAAIFNFSVDGNVSKECSFKVTTHLLLNINTKKYYARQLNVKSALEYLMVGNSMIFNLFYLILRVIYRSCYFCILSLIIKELAGGLFLHQTSTETEMQNVDGLILSFFNFGLIFVFVQLFWFRASNSVS